MMNGNVKIGQFAPDFEASSTLGSIKLSDYKGKWVVLLSYPGDFKPVCTTEIIGFSNANTYFENLNTSLIGLSVDSIPSHLAWINDIYTKTGIYVQFPIIADRNGEIARKYGMISNDVNKSETVRNVRIIDDKGKIRSILTYPIQIGRSISEIIRVIEALQKADKENILLPLNWIPGEPLMQEEPNTLNEIIDREDEINKNRNGISWYLNFKNNEENSNVG